MKQLLPFNPVFSPGASGVGTLGFGQWPNFAVDKLYAVINVTRNQPLYIAGAPGLGLTAISADSKTITLAFNTSSYSTGDQLNVYYDTAPGYESNFAAEYGGQLQLTQENLDLILIELRVMNRLLAQGFTIADNDVDQLRNDMEDPRAYNANPYQ